MSLMPGASKRVTAVRQLDQGGAWPVLQSGPFCPRPVSIAWKREGLLTLLPTGRRFQQSYVRRQPLLAEVALSRTSRICVRLGHAGP